MQPIQYASSCKLPGNHNPLYTQRFGADPGMLVWDGRLYVYTTNDAVTYDAEGKPQENTYSNIRTINCISSADLVNWTDHGPIPVAGKDGAAVWASNSWAPCAAHKNIGGVDRFFLYFCNGGNGVSVLTADSPAGPWRDPLGHGLITRDVPNCANVLWLFDPAVFVDNDGTGYLFFGGGVPQGMQADPGTIRCVQLGEDMISLACEPKTVHAPYVFEDSGINRIGDTYYYTYCSNFTTGGNDMGITNGAIQYMTADHPMGPYTWRGEFFRNPEVFFGLGGNNHHSLITFKGEHYLAYHARTLETPLGITGNYRSPHLNKLIVNGDGTLGMITGDMQGVPQVEPFCPYGVIPAATMARQGGIEVTGHDESVQLCAKEGSWVQLEGVAFDKGAARFTIRAASEKGGSVILTADRQDAAPLCVAQVPAGEAADITVAMESLTGTHDLYLTFTGDVTADWWQIAAE
ncbi:MAG: family 43 glycosylhydrolase [Clostridia bacterium]|nr:family 43 glycosylhydrolase [Clostridia bacterium]